MPRRKAREDALERNRIEAAMDLIDAAKLKAKSQREEYGKYLVWKVQMQRKERKQREKEEADMRKRVDERLRVVLQEHRKQRHEDIVNWKKFAALPVPPKPKKKKKAQVDPREQELQRQAEETKQRRAEELESTREAIRKTIARRRTATQEQQEAEIPQTTSSGLELPTMPDHSADDELHSSTWVQQELDRRSKLQGKIDKKNNVVNSMFNKARSRRLYSMARMTADPPADYLMGADLLRYIPTEVLEGGASNMKKSMDAATTQEGGTGADFFITELNEQGSTGPRDIPTKAASAPAGRKELKWKRWDPLSFRLQKLHVPQVEIEVARVKEEEDATVEWYQKHYAPLTKITNRSEIHGRHYSWKRQGKHSLPPTCFSGPVQKLPG